MPAEKLSWLSTNIHTLLQELNVHGDSPNPFTQTDSTSAQRNCVSNILWYFKNNKPHQGMINMNSPESSHINFRHPATHMPEYYNNAKYKDILCKPIKPLNDGSPDHLVPFLNHLDVCCQDEGRYPITFLTIQRNKYNLITVDHRMPNSRVFGQLLLHSITDHFSLTIINRIQTPNIMIPLSLLN